MIRRLTLASVLAAALGAGHAAGQTTTAPAVPAGALPAPTTPPRPPRLLPWFEFCTGSKAEGEQLVQLCTGLQAWTDGAIVVTQPGGEWIYPELARRVPYLSILPGARVVQIEPKRGLDDPLRWEAVAAFVRTALGATRTRRFVLEVEYPLNDYWGGRQPLDLAGLAAGLRRLPAHVEYIWYPAGLAHSNQPFVRDSLVRCLSLWRTIQSAMPSVVFATHGPANTPYHVDRPWEQINDALLRSEGRRTLDSVYIGDTYPGLWPMSRAREAISRVRTAEAYVWCPLEEWPTLSAQLARPVLAPTAADEGREGG